MAIGRDYVDNTVEFDPTGFRTARGLARFFLIVGTLIAFVGFGLVGYMMLNAFGSFQDVMAQGANVTRTSPSDRSGSSATSTSGRPDRIRPMGSGGLRRHVRRHGRVLNRDDDERNTTEGRSAPVGERVAAGS